MKATKRRKAAAGSGQGGRSQDEGGRLWTRYRRSRRLKLRNQLVERYRGQVESIAHSLAGRLPRSVDVQDLVHAGLWGLMQAIENFEPERGTSFSTFMRMRVRGAMMDELRNMDYLPRLYRHRMRKLDEVQERLRDTLERDPSDAELAEEMGVTESRLRHYAVQGRSPRPPAEPQQEDGSERDAIDCLADDDLESPLETLDRQDMLEKIEASLQPVEWKVLRLHYLEGMSGKDVARKLRLSASRICQIHMRVLSRLKARLSS